jgi:Tfp pilus assembly protein PilN
MIRINLIADEKNRKGGGDSPFGFFAEVMLLSILVLAGAGVVFFIYAGMEDRITTAKVKVAQEKQTIKNLGKAEKTLKNFKEKRKELKRQIDIINKLKSQKQGPVRVLDQMGERMPKQVWLTGVRQRKRGKVLVIRGKAESNESVAIFLKRLEDSPYFETVDLQRIVRRKQHNKGQENTVTTVFSVQCKVLLFVQDT